MIASVSMSLCSMLKWRSGVLQLPMSNKSGTRCELVAISQGCIEKGYKGLENVLGGDYVEFGQEHSPKPGEKYKFYNVLWIEWLDGVAYRKTLGRVEKSR